MLVPLVKSPVDLIRSYWEGGTKKTPKELSSRPVEAFKEYCRLEPWAPECKIFDI